MKKRNLSIFTLLLLFALLMLPGKNVSAASVTQVNPAKDSITIKWNSVGDDVTQYYVQLANEYYDLDGATKKNVDAGKTSYKFSGLSAGRNYFVRVTYDYTNKSGKKYLRVLESIEVSTLPGPITGLKEYGTWKEDALEITWNQQSGVDGYEYIFKNAANKTIRRSTSESVYPYGYCTNPVNEVYLAYVRAYKTINSKKYYSPYSNICLFADPEVSHSTKVSKNKLTVKWKKIKGATSYSVYVSTKKKSGYVKVKTISAKKNKLTIKKLKKAKIKNNKTYYIYVVANKKVGTRTYKSKRISTYKVKGRNGSLF